MEKTHQGASATLPESSGTLRLSSADNMKTNCSFALVSELEINCKCCKVLVYRELRLAHLAGISPST
jgi:hypothetical protein